MNTLAHIAQTDINADKFRIVIAEATSALNEAIIQTSTFNPSDNSMPKQWEIEHRVQDAVLVDIGLGILGYNVTALLFHHFLINHNSPLTADNIAEIVNKMNKEKEYVEKLRSSMDSGTTEGAYSFQAKDLYYAFHNTDYTVTAYDVGGQKIGLVKFRDDFNFEYWDEDHTDNWFGLMVNNYGYELQEGGLGVSYPIEFFFVIE